MRFPCGSIRPQFPSVSAGAAVRLAVKTRACPGLPRRSGESASLWPPLVCKYTPRAQETVQPLEEFPGIFRFTFPDHAHAPTERVKFAHIFFVAPPVAFQLRSPIFKACLWNARTTTAAMLMPEAPPHFNNAFPPREHEVRRARQLRSMEPIAVSHAMDNPPHNHFWRSVPVANPAHDRRALFWRDGVGHTYSLAVLYGPRKRWPSK